jgi:hypothetical protein
MLSGATGNANVGYGEVMGAKSKPWASGLSSAKINSVIKPDLNPL